MGNHNAIQRSKLRRREIYLAKLREEGNWEAMARSEAQTTRVNADRQQQLQLQQQMQNLKIGKTYLFKLM